MDEQLYKKSEKKNKNPKTVVANSTVYISL